MASIHGNLSLLLPVPLPCRWYVRKYWTHRFILPPIKKLNVYIIQLLACRSSSFCPIVHRYLCIVRKGFSANEGHPPILPSLDKGNLWGKSQRIRFLIGHILTTWRGGVNFICWDGTAHILSPLSFCYQSSHRKRSTRKSVAAGVALACPPCAHLSAPSEQVTRYGQIHEWTPLITLAMILGYN